MNNNPSQGGSNDTDKIGKSIGWIMLFVVIAILVTTIIRWPSSVPVTVQTNTVTAPAPQVLPVILPPQMATGTTGTFQVQSMDLDLTSFVKVMPRTNSVKK